MLDADPIAVVPNDPLIFLVIGLAGLAAHDVGLNACESASMFAFWHGGWGQRFELVNKPGWPSPSTTRHRPVGTRPSFVRV